MGEVSVPLPIWNWERRLPLCMLELSQGGWRKGGRIEWHVGQIGPEHNMGIIQKFCLSCTATQKGHKGQRTKIGVVGVWRMYKTWTRSPEAEQQTSASYFYPSSPTRCGQAHHQQQMQRYRG